jgi:membrane protein
MLTSLYLVMPAGRMSLRHALLGGVTAALLWELTRRVLIWYFSTLSQVNVVYGSLTTAIVVLLSLEIAATLVLLGAQVIAKYERLDRTGSTAKPPAVPGATGCGQRGARRIAPSRRITSPLSMSFSMMCLASLA